MKAAVRDRYGPPDVVDVREVDIPVPSADQVLVRVCAASINRADLDGLYPRWQFMRLFLGLRKPRIRGLGLDVAGVVESVGPDVTRFRPGDEVFGDLFEFGLGAFAEYVCARETAFTSMPVGIPFEEAATLPHSAILALQGTRLRDGRSIGRGDRVLIVGASGNVGPFAWFGGDRRREDREARLRTFPGCGSRDRLHGGGCHQDGRSVRLDPRCGRAPLHPAVAAGAAAQRRLRGARGAGGWFLKALPQGPAVSLATGKHMGLMLWWKPFKAEDVETLKELVAAGTVKPAIDRRFALSEVRDALRYVDQGRAKGKVVITV